MGNQWPAQLAALDSFALRRTGHAGWIGCPRVDHFIGILAIAQIRLKSHGTSANGIGWLLPVNEGIVARQAVAGIVWTRRLMRTKRHLCQIQKTAAQYERRPVHRLAMDKHRRRQF
jgi:hypothetical protein